MLRLVCLAMAFVSTALAEEWQQRYPWPTLSGGVDVAHYDGRWYVAGKDGFVLSSPDVRHWQRDELATNGMYSHWISYARESIVQFAGDASRLFALGELGSIYELVEKKWVKAPHQPDALPGVVSAVYANEALVALTHQGIYRSTNFQTWTSVPVSLPNRLNVITFGNGLFVAVGEAATAGPSPQSATIVSSNGVDWAVGEARTTSPFLDLVFQNGEFYALNADNRIYKSANGINWSAAALPPQNYWYTSLSAGNGVVLAHGQHPAISVDGVSWQLRTNSFFRPAFAAFGDGLGVAVGGGLWTSTNFVDWTQTLDLWEGGGPLAIGASGDLAVALTGERFVHSDQGILWTGGARDLEVIFEATKEILYGNGTFIAKYVEFISDPFQLRSIARTSRDGRNWSLAPSLTGLSLAWDQTRNRWVALRFREPSIFVSADLENWSVLPSPEAENFIAIWILNGKYIALTTTGTQLAFSDDGVNWRFPTMPGSDSIRDVAFGDGRYVVTTGNNVVLVSDDGDFWVRRAAMRALTIAHGNGLFIIGGEAGQVRVSPDGASWSPLNLPVKKDVLEIIPFKNAFLALTGVGGAIYQSRDFSGRPRLRSPETFIFDGKAHVTAETGEAAVDLETSSDLENWTPVASFTSNSVERAEIPTSSKGFFRLKAK